MKPSPSTVTVTLCVAASVVAITLASFKMATWLEAASFVTGAVCVWLTVKENVWNFPLGLLNAATFCVVFYRSGLFADAGLQVVYFVLVVIGWRSWLYGGERRTPLKVTRASTKELAILIVLVVMGTIGL